MGTTEELSHVWIDAHLLHARKVTSSGRYVEAHAGWITGGAGPSVTCSSLQYSTVEVTSCQDYKS